MASNFKKLSIALALAGFSTAVQVMSGPASDILNRYVDPFHFTPLQRRLKGCNYQVNSYNAYWYRRVIDAVTGSNLYLTSQDNHAFYARVQKDDTDNPTILLVDMYKQGWPTTPIKLNELLSDCKSKSS